MGLTAPPVRGPDPGPFARYLGRTSEAIWRQGFIRELTFDFEDEDDPVSPEDPIGLLASTLALLPAVRQPARHAARSRLIVYFAGSRRLMKLSIRLAAGGSRFASTTIV